MRTDKEFITALEQQIRFPVSEDFREFRTRLLTMTWRFREEEKREEFRQKREHKLYVDRFKKERM